MRKEGKCEICGAVFVQSGNGLKKYCSRLCYKKASKARDRANNYYRGNRQGCTSPERTCAICGKVFVSSATGRKKYCSYECAAEGAKRKSKENGYYKRGARRRCCYGFGNRDGFITPLSRSHKTYAEIRAENRARPIVAGWRGQAVAGGCAVSLSAVKAVAK